MSVLITEHQMDYRGKQETLTMQHKNKSISLDKYKTKRICFILDLQEDKEGSSDHSKLQPLNHLLTEENVFSADYSLTETKKNENSKALVIERYRFIRSKTTRGISTRNRTRGTSLEDFKRILEESERVQKLLVVVTTQEAIVRENRELLLHTPAFLHKTERPYQSLGSIWLIL